MQMQLELELELEIPVRRKNSLREFQRTPNRSKRLSLYVTRSESSARCGYQKPSMNL